MVNEDVHKRRKVDNDSSDLKENYEDNSDYWPDSDSDHGNAFMNGIFLNIQNITLILSFVNYLVLVCKLFNY